MAFSISDSGVFCVFFLKPIKQYYNVSIIKNEKYSVDIPTILSTEFKQSISDKLDKFCRNSILNAK